MGHSFGVSDGVRSFQDSRVCISVEFLPKLVMLHGRDASFSEDADRGAFLIFWSLFRCSQDATGMCVCVCVSSLIAVTFGLAARPIKFYLHLVTCRVSWSS